MEENEIWKKVKDAYVRILKEVASYIETMSVERFKKMVENMATKDCPKSPDGFHHIRKGPRDPDVTGDDQFCIYCGEAIW